MEEEKNLFFNSLKKGPAFLFLGQNYLQGENGTDPFLQSIQKKYGNPSDKTRGYSLIFNGTALNNSEISLSWMHNLSQRISPPETMEKIVQYCWSGVYTSAIDDVILRAFRTQWREVDPIFSTIKNPDDPRNKHKLHCTFLFGNVNRIEEDELPPLNKTKLTVHRSIANQLLARLPSQITSLGCLVIDAYDPTTDWLRIEDIIPHLDTCIKNHIKVFFFNATDDLINNEEIIEINQGKTILFFKDGLYEAFIQAEKEKLIELNIVPDEESLNRYIEINHKTISVPSKLWNVVTESATIIDDSKLITPPQISSEKLYYEFRNFISNAGILLEWSGFLRGFAFNRDYEEQLLTIVREDLKSNQLPDFPIILSGQTGTGKSVALKHLAVKIRAEKEIPVLFIERRTQLPKKEDIEVFCRWAEDHKSKYTLVIWDGMLTPDYYQEALKDLTGRGRKVVLVGSCYRLNEEREFLNNRIIEAPASLNDLEIKRFLPYIAKYDPLFISNIKEKEISLKDELFLVILFRLLPASRSNIRAGVQTEVRVSELKIQDFTINNIRQGNYDLLGLSLENSDEKIKKYVEELKKETNFGGDRVNPIECLIGLIMTPGKFGIDVPLDLLSRTLKKFGYIELFDILNQVDIFQLYEDPVGNIFVGPRHPLEAKIICQQRFGSLKTEILYICELIDKIQSHDDDYRDSEILFTRDIIHQLSPNGPEDYLFLDYYPVLIESLKKLRQERQIYKPQLILQEAFLSREFVKQKSVRREIPENAEKILLDAKKLLESTIARLKTENRLIIYQDSLLVELAAINGTLANHAIQNSIKNYDFSTIYTNISNYLNQVLNKVINDEHALDVYSWVSINLISEKIFDANKNSEIISNALSALDNSESGGFDTSTKLLSRKFEIFKLIGEDMLADTVFEQLKKQYSCAGYYLKSVYPIRDIPNDQEYNKRERELFLKSHSFLEENRDFINKDDRCLRQLLFSWWKGRTGRPLFFNERQVLNFTVDEWKYVKGILLDLKSLEKLENNPSLMYIFGLTCFHLKEVPEAKHIFLEIERNTSGIRGKRRIVRSYLASTPAGHPRVFHGDVQWIDAEKIKGKLNVEELHTTIPFFPKDFNLPHLRKGDSIGEFHIGFNFIGPIADPISYTK